jgi:Ca-activated chloride channel homolog
VKDSPLVASVSPERVKPGDPLISVRAPRDARSVSIALPFGESKRARWDDERSMWTARFLVPAGTADGSYPIKVAIEEADGSRRTLALSIRVDTHAPALEAPGLAVRAGQLVPLRARATLGVTEIASALAERSDPYEAVKALFDVRRVTAHLWDGRDVELTLDPTGFGFVAMAETNRSLAPGRYPVVLTAQDFAGNASRTETYVEVSAP